MEFLCYRNKNNSKILSDYTYCAESNGVKLFAGDLMGIGIMISNYAENRNEVTLLGDMKKHEYKKWEMPNPHGLPKRVLEELALIVKNKTSHHRDVKVE